MIIAGAPGDAAVLTGPQRLARENAYRAALQANQPAREARAARQALLAREARHAEETRLAREAQVARELAVAQHEEEVVRAAREHAARLAVVWQIGEDIRRAEEARRREAEDRQAQQRECSHRIPWWHKNTEPSVKECDHRFFEYILECERCRLQACVRCKRKRRWDRVGG